MKKRGNNAHIAKKGVYVYLRTSEGTTKKAQKRELNLNAARKSKR